uniref:C2H2-type domain-containing protein n=1 Tax=Hucho hucho TaxID=62062 RepID=A0A4W5KGX0_9TELE
MVPRSLDYFSDFLRLRGETGESSSRHSDSEGASSTSGEPEQQDDNHTAKNTHSCRECGEEFPTQHYLRKHRNTTHTGEKKTSPKPRKSYSCLDCGKEFPCPSKLQRHLLTHTGERPCFCSDCGKSFTREEHLKTHQRFHCSNGEGSPSISGDPEQAKNCCLECGREFSSAYKLRRHLLIHTGEKPHSCSVCGKSYTYLHTLKSHELKHTGEKSYKCSVCEKSFNQKGNLNQHMLVHTGEKPFSCSVCGKCFTQKANLTAHQLSHTGEKPFSCPICRKGFTQKAYLKQHQKLHTGEKPYACSECDKRFTFCTSLKRHQLQHTGEKPDSLILKEVHQQSHGKTVEESLSASAAEPEQHQENHKTKTSSHCCSECGKHFKTSSSLQIHMRIHTGKKPYPCPDCGKKFATKGSLNLHQRSHTTEAEKPIHCDVEKTSQGQEMVSDNLQDLCQTLGLKAKVEEEKEEVEEDEEGAKNNAEEVGGLINSDGEEVDWDSVQHRENPVHGSGSEGSPPTSHINKVGENNDKHFNTRYCTIVTIINIIIIYFTVLLNPFLFQHGFHSNFIRIGPVFILESW